MKNFGKITVLAAGLTTTIMSGYNCYNYVENIMELEKNRTEFERFYKQDRTSRDAYELGVYFQNEAMKGNQSGVAGSVAWGLVGLVLAGAAADALNKKD